LSKIQSSKEKIERVEVKKNMGNFFYTLGLPIFIVGLSIFFTISEPRFLSLQNFQNVARQASGLTLLAVGEAFAIISGGIDISVGSIVGFAGIFTVVALQNFGLVGLLVGPVVGAFVGLITGSIISRFRVAPFVVTLAALTILRGSIYLYTGGLPIFGNLPAFFVTLGTGFFAGVPITFIVGVIGLVICWLFLTYTYPGRYLYAIGSNEQAAWLSGIDTTSIKTMAYVLTGLLSGIAGVLFSARVNSGQPNLGSLMELDAIAAAVIGGVSLTGGKGTMVGVFYGVILLSIVRNGLNLIEVSSFAQMVVVGLIIVIAVVIDALEHRKE